MSDRDAQDGHNTRLLRALLWGGVGLAPVAALLVLIGGSEGPTRFGVLLIAVSVVLLGAVLLIRHDPVLLRMDVEDRVADEVNALRAELRAELAAGAPPRPAPSPVDRPAAATRHEPATRVPPGPNRIAGGSARVPAVPGREPGLTTGGRAAVRRESGPQPAGRGATGAARPPAGPAGGRAGAPPPLGSGHAPPVPGHAPPVPGQRGRGVAAPPPMAPVFRPPPSHSYGAHGEPVRDQGGRRRADATAIDLGYTGRRAKPDHYDDADFGGPEPGYPGWAEADEHRPAAQPLNEQYDWRGRERTGGW